MTKTIKDKKYTRDVHWTFVLCVASEFSPHWLGDENDIGLDCQEDPPSPVSEGDTLPGEGEQHYFKYIVDQQWSWECTGDPDVLQNMGIPEGGAK